MGKKQQEEVTFPTARILRLREMIDYTSGGIVSKQVIKSDHGNVTLFAFSAGEGLSEHSSPYEALVQVIEGIGEIVIGGKKHRLESGESILMPADIPHAVAAPGPFKMLLTMIK